MSASRTYGGEAYTKATYDNLVQHDQWNYDALGVINKNIINQHTQVSKAVNISLPSLLFVYFSLNCRGRSNLQMRKELQNRHQDITNDVNQYTTCIANYLGVQIISNLPGATTSPLSSLCRQLLGLSGRRLEDGTNEDQNDAPFNIEAFWGKKSVVMQQRASMEMESKILEKEEIILKALSKIEKRLGVNCANSRYNKKYDLAK